ncbi:MAG TPA: M18 family aminopeptidase [Candidatus Fournierella merdigallinarum]|nr:M18 family aminopeptidase [Candidatus Fournierella merdigallinarum]
MNETRDLFDFIAASPSPWHAVQAAASRLQAAGFVPLDERQTWRLAPGGRYYTLREGSSLIAWRQPAAPAAGWRMAAAHSDSPAFKVKGAAVKSGCTLLLTEGYGGMIRASWLDRPLGLAGRVLVRAGDGVEARLIAPDRDLAVIPHPAIHLDRALNDGHKYDPKADMQALFAPGEAAGSYKALLAAEAGCDEADILGEDILLYCRQPGATAGPAGELVLCPRLDDLACAWATLRGFLEAPEKEEGVLWCLFDSEEVGSGTRQGALGSFLPDVLAAAGEALGQTAQDRRRALAASLLLSADNGHAIHPNFPALADQDHPVRLGGGVVLKFNANQKYATTGLTAALFRAVCQRAGVPVQDYYNRPDMPGGSTLGNLLSTRVGVPMADIGLPQLAMHSCVETAAAADLAALHKACAAWYAADLAPAENGWAIG